MGNHVREDIASYYFSICSGERKDGGRDTLLEINLTYVSVESAKF